MSALPTGPTDSDALPDAPPLRQCSLCGAWGYRMIPSLGGLVVCQSCDDQFKRAPGRAAGNEIRENMADLKRLE